VWEWCADGYELKLPGGCDEILLKVVFGCKKEKGGVSCR
jgi:hypothetical protein